MGGLLRLALVGATAVLVAPAYGGIRVQPMAYDLAPSGSDAQQDLRVENTSDKPLPVELRVERRTISEDGTEKRTPADDDFLVFPPQGIVPPNGFQTFRVRYVGDPSLPKTALYTITVAQLPVDTTGQDSGVQLLFNLGTLAAVSPRNSKPHFVVTSTERGSQPGKLRITVRNDGTSYARLRQGKWTLTSGSGRSEVLEGMPLQEALPQPLIEPMSTRTIELPVSADFRTEGAKAAFEYTPTRK